MAVSLYIFWEYLFITMGFLTLSLCLSELFFIILYVSYIIMVPLTSTWLILKSMLHLFGSLWEFNKSFGFASPEKHTAYFIKFWVIYRPRLRTGTLIQWSQRPSRRQKGLKEVWTLSCAPYALAESGRQATWQLLKGLGIFPFVDLIFHVNWYKYNYLLKLCLQPKKKKKKSKRHW